MAEYLHKKHFTVAQAKGLLTAIKPLAEELVGLKRVLDERGYDMHRHQYFGGSGPNGERAYPPELIRLVEIAQNIERKGVLIKGIDEGLIDFPHVRSNGEEVYLCWKVGEVDILYWHRIPDGFAGRRSITEL